MKDLPIETMLKFDFSESQSSKWNIANSKTLQELRAIESGELPLSTKFMTLERVAPILTDADGTLQYPLPELDGTLATYSSFLMEFIATYKGSNLKKLKAALKSLLPCVMNSARVTSDEITVTNRDTSKITDILNFVVIDIDGNLSKDGNDIGVVDMYEVAKSIPNAMYVKQSPSGTGVKIKMAIDVTEDKRKEIATILARMELNRDPNLMGMDLKVEALVHKAIVAELASYFLGKGIKVDTSGSDLVRIEYLSVGNLPVYMNEEAIPFTPTFEDVIGKWELYKNKLTDKATTKKKGIQPTATRVTPTNNKKTTDFKLKRTKDGRILSTNDGSAQKAFVEDIIEKGRIPWRNYDEWIKCCGGIVSYFESIDAREVGVYLAEALSANEVDNFDKAVFDKMINSGLNRCGFGSLLEICRRNNIDINEDLLKSSAHPAALILPYQEGDECTTLYNRNNLSELVELVAVDDMKEGRVYYRRVIDKFTNVRKWIPFDRISFNNVSDLSLESQIITYSGVIYDMTANSGGAISIHTSTNARYLNEYIPVQDPEFDGDATPEDFPVFDEIMRQCGDKADMIWELVKMAVYNKTQPLPALILAGKQGTGKSTIAKVLELVISGKQSAQGSLSGVFKNKFGYHYKKEILLLNENDMKATSETTENMKVFLTSRGSFMEIEEKSGHPYIMRTSAFMIMATNKEEGCLGLTMADSAKVCVIDPLPYKAVNRTEVEVLTDVARERGAILKYLRTKVKLSKDDPSNKVNSNRFRFGIDADRYANSAENKRQLSGYNNDEESRVSIIVDKYISNIAEDMAYMTTKKVVRADGSVVISKELIELSIARCYNSKPPANISTFLDSKFAKTKLMNTVQPVVNSITEKQVDFQNQEFIRREAQSRVYVIPAVMIEEAVANIRMAREEDSTLKPQL